ncbi:O-methyltransferase family protein [Rhynchospora pubera]|uniref:O-methyltransferase family protein n=1 Tax=Rhynchospora pubera TaxID=906938 RepID=A0AAV8HTG3_9POAL|nr:O-methyltransferase family protein [Rhynchospora pubera]
MLDRMLALLASFNIVSCAIEKKEKMVRRYGPSPFFNLLTKDGDGATATLCLLGTEQAFISAGQNLKEAVLEGGIAFEKAHGMKAFEYVGTYPSCRRLFDKAMKDNSTFFLKKMLETYQGFKDVHVLVDVGGGVGVALGKIVSKYPHIKGINFDLPDAIAAALTLPGVEHVGGNMFDYIPHGDAILLKWVLHNWSDEHCVKILKNCYNALPNEGKVIIVDIILPVNPEPTTRSKGAFILDVMMMINFGGKERTKIEFEKLGKEVGFTRVEAQYIYGDVWVIELRK